MRIEGLFTLAQAKRALEKERVDAPQRTHTLHPAGARMVQDGEHRLPVQMFEVHQFVDLSEVPEDHIVVHGTTVVYTSKLFAAMLELQREEFETAMLALYDRNSSMVPLEDRNADLFWRTETGMYGVKQFNAAWYGWLAARGIET